LATLPRHHAKGNPNAMTAQTTNSMKSEVLKLLAQGLVTMSEAAEMAGTTKQLVRYWARDIDLPAARARYLARLEALARRRADGRKASSRG
jgi:hypothetical protein